MGSNQPFLQRDVRLVEKLSLDQLEQPIGYCKTEITPDIVWVTTVSGIQVVFLQSERSRGPSLRQWTACNKLLHTPARLLLACGTSCRLGQDLIRLEGSEPGGTPSLRGRCYCGAGGNREIPASAVAAAARRYRLLPACPHQAWRRRR